MIRTKSVAELNRGDRIDLEGVDIAPANQHIWPFEHAVVETVSTKASPSGGWADGFAADAAIVYMSNGATPAIVPLGAVFFVDTDSERR